MPFEARALACCWTIWEFTILAKLFQEFHPIGAAQKQAVAETASSNTKRTRARYHWAVSAVRLRPSKIDGNGSGELVVEVRADTGTAYVGKFPNADHAAAIE